MGKEEEKIIEIIYGKLKGTVKPIFYLSPHYLMTKKKNIYTQINEEVLFDKDG